MSALLRRVPPMLGLTILALIGTLIIVLWVAP